MQIGKKHPKLRNLKIFLVSAKHDHIASRYRDFSVLTGGGSPNFCDFLRTISRKWDFLAEKLGNLTIPNYLTVSARSAEKFLPNYLTRRRKFWKFRAKCYQNLTFVITLGLNPESAIFEPKS